MKWVKNELRIDNYSEKTIHTVVQAIGAVKSLKIFGL